MRVLIVTQYYPPERATIAPAIAHWLKEKGHDVRVLTGFPNYPEGKIFPGYKQRWRSRERHDGVEILRVPLWADHSTSALRRTLNYVSFALTTATARGFAREADVIYVYATQMTPAFGPWLWRKFRGAPYVLHVQDLWPDSILESSMVAGSRAGNLIRLILEPWLRSAYNDAAGVIGIAPTMVRTLIKRGSDSGKTKLIFNWADDATPLAANKKRTKHTEFLFAGNIGDMQDLETVIRAAHLVEDLPVTLKIVGDGVSREKIKALAGELECKNVTFYGAVPRSSMPEVYADADFSLVTLRDLEVFRGTIPSKFQSSIANGVPVVSTVQGDLRELVERHGIGFTAEGGDAESLAYAIRAAHSMTAEDYREMQYHTREVYLDHFSRRAGLDAVNAVLTEAASEFKTKDK